MQTTMPVGEGLSEHETENLIVAQLSGDPGWRWMIDLKHALAASMNGHHFQEAVTRLVAAGRFERQLVPGRGFQIRFASPKVDPSTGGAR